MRYLRAIPPGPVLAVLAVVGLWTMGRAPSATGRVPDLQGSSAERAQLSAEHNGYTLTVEQVTGPGVAGTVLSQIPQAGTLLARGSRIVVRVTKGKRQVTVPNVEGMPVGMARSVLTQAGVRAGDVTYRSAPDKEPNRVIGTDPPAGSHVDVGTIVGLIAAA